MQITAFSKKAPFVTYGRLASALVTQVIKFIDPGRIRDHVSNDLALYLQPSPAGLSRFERYTAKRIIIRMKMTVAILLFACMQVSAAGYAQRITMSRKNAPVEHVLKEIKNQTGYLFFYNQDWLKQAKSVDIHVKNASINQVLDIVFNDQPVVYSIVDKTIILSQKTASEAKVPAMVEAPAPPKEIRGKVTDSNGGPLPGVSIRIKGSVAGTSTDMEGNYVLNIPDDGVLTFSYIGFVTQEVSTSGRSTINIVMVDDQKSLSEVVVVGYGTQQKKDVVGAVGVASSKEFGDVSVSNTSQLIQGKLAGVQVINNSGTPGAGSQIVIRGTGSFTNAAPLYVIDGIQSDAGTFNALSPYDIQDITVLKDASSVAIYGAQGANGVIMITTSRPKTGAPSIRFNSYVGIANVWKKFDLMNAEEYTGLVKDYYINSGKNLPLRVGTPDALITRTDWQDEIFQNGLLTENHLTIGGGTPNVTYSLSAGHTKQEGQVIGFNYQRTNLRLNLTENIGKRIKLGQQLNIRNQSSIGEQADISSALRMPPYISVYDPSNTLGGFGIATSVLDGNDATNPLIRPNLVDRKNRGLNTYLQLFGELDIIDGLKFRSQLGGSYNFNQNYSFNPQYAGNQLITFDGIQETYNYGLGYILENYFTYNKKLKSHQINLTAGNSYRDGGTSRSISVSGSNFPNSEIHSIGAAKTQLVTGSSANSPARFISYFARANYTFKDRYIFTATGRRDATSLFSKSERVGYFPSVGLGWRVSEEGFMKKIPFIYDLKLRSSWGKTGNSNIRGFTYESNVWSGSANSLVYSFGPNEALVNGSTIAVAASPNLRWESTTTFDIGLDAGFLQNKLTLSAGYYNRKNEDLLVSVPIPASRGYGGTGGNGSTELINAASAFNKGFELTLGFDNKAGNLSYGVSVNGAYNKNEVISLGTQGAVPILDGTFNGVPPMTRTEPGHEIGAFYGYVYDHVAIDAADIARYNDIARQKTGNPTAVYQSGLLPGDRIFKDLNNDGVLTAADQEFLGSSIPKWNYGLNLNLAYKNFDFMASLQGLAGVQYINAFKYYTEGFALPFNAKRDLLDSWKKPGDITDHSRIGQNTSVSANFRNSSWYVEDGNFARIRNVTLGYTIPRDKVRPLTGNIVSSARFYVTGQNLFTFTNYSGFDPEVTGSGNFIFARGIDTGQTPQSRTFMFGLQVGF